MLLVFAILFRISASICVVERGSNTGAEAQKTPQPRQNSAVSPCPVPKLRSLAKIIGIEEHFLSPAVRASWAPSAGAGQDASESLHLGDIQDRLEELSDERLARMND